jgi:hypothetical protein
MAFTTAIAYNLFEDEVRTVSRYIYSEETHKFFADVLESARKRVVRVERERVYFRAQIGYEERWREKIFLERLPYSADRMKPRPYKCAEGRANSKGIPRLYMATDTDTAIAECRPWMSAILSIATMKLIRDCRMVDCSSGTRAASMGFIDDDAEDPEEVIWGEITHAFSEPVQQDDTSADYAPTQVLADLFQSAGYDGVAYKSMLGDGFNVALFDLSLAEVANVRLSKIESVKYEHEWQKS